MANYKEASVTGTKWTRAPRIVFLNPHNGVPSVQIEEEEITELADGRVVNTPLGSLTAALDNPAATFPLLNPADGSVVGSMTHGELYAAIFSMYMALGAIRDAG
jgi:hypothetical protein